MRASLALDVMEAVRPQVDAYLHDLIEGHVFRAGDFHETRTGVCRVNPPLTHHLAQTLNLWYDLVAPVVAFTHDPSARRAPPLRESGLRSFPSRLTG